MKLQVIYCSTPDGMGEDITKLLDLPIDPLSPEMVKYEVILYSIHRQDINFIQYLLDTLNIGIQQLISVKLID